MLILVSVGVLLITALVMLILRAVRPQFSYYWLIASVGTILAVLPLILLRFQLPTHVTMISWRSESFSIQSPTLLIDQLSWPIALSLLIVLLASLFTDVNRPTRSAIDTWVVGLLLTAFGMLAVFSANLATLILVWVILDAFVLILGPFGFLRDWETGETLNSLIVRLFSVGFLSGAILTWNHYSQMSSINNIPEQITALLMLAAGLRISAAVVAETTSFTETTNTNTLVILRINSIAASGILLIRAANSGMSAGVTPGMLMVGIILTFIGGVQFLVREGRANNRALWFLGFTALTVAPITQNNPEAASAIIIAVIFACGALYLPGLPHPKWKFLNWMMVIGMSALPLTPLYPFGSMVSGSFNPWFIGFGICHIGLLYSFLRISGFSYTNLEGAERWITAIFIAGLGMLPVSFLVLGFVSFEDVRTAISHWYYGAPVLIITIAVGLILRTRDQVMKSPVDARSFISLRERFRHSVQEISKAVDDGYRYVVTALENEGGILWSLVIVILLISLILRLE